MTQNTTRLKRILSLALTLTCLLSAPYAATGSVPDSGPTEVQYREVTGDQEKFFSWHEHRRQDGRVVISLAEKDTEFINICTPTGETLEWRYREGQRIQLHAWREDGRIMIRGTMDGKAVEKEVKIDGRPWYQALSYSLRDFLASDDRRTSFWIIRANTLDVYALKAEKIQSESIETITGPVMANQVEVRAEGMLSGFWHGTYWYRQGDGLFLRYRSVQGPLGAEETVVNLASFVIPGTGRL